MSEEIENTTEETVEEKEVESTNESEPQTESAENSSSEEQEASSDDQGESAEEEATEQEIEVVAPQTTHADDGMEWYVVHTYSGYENKAKLALEERIRSLSKQEYFSEVVVPEENVIELVKGQKRTTKRRFFPGYILVRMKLTNDSWHIVKDTPKVTGFVGNKNNPIPVPDSEVQRMTNRIAEGQAKPRPKVSFKEGESIRVVDGPFSNFSGTVEEVNLEKGKVKVMVSIFGRSTPVELDFIQVEKI